MYFYEKTSVESDEKCCESIEWVGNADLKVASQFSRKTRSKFRLPIIRRYVLVTLARHWGLMYNIAKIQMQHSFMQFSVKLFSHALFDTNKFSKIMKIVSVYASLFNIPCKYNWYSQRHRKIGLLQLFARFLSYTRHSLYLLFSPPTEDLCFAYLCAVSNLVTEKSREKNPMIRDGGWEYQLYLLGVEQSSLFLRC